jgi:Fe-S cluster assembly scaffold protein SufB
MEIKVNETPVRTSRNFRINNIKLENVVIPENLEEFKNVELIADDIVIEKSIEESKLTYGNGELLENNVLKYANNIIKLTTTKKQQNIKVIYTLDDKNLNLVNNIKIVANHDVNVTILYKTETNKECFHNGIIKIDANENVKVNVAIINLLNNNSYNFDSIENKIYSNANVKYTIIDLGGKYSISNYYSDIIGENAENELKTIYLGVDNQVKDINYIAELKGQKSIIDIDVQGTLKDYAKKNFKGTIDFKKGCKKAKGDENEFCMLLSPNAKSLALPMLLCTEDDVEGNHSTASGKVDEKSLFYITSRGFSESEAIKLIVRARFNKIIERIEDEDIKNTVLDEIDKRLD